MEGINPIDLIALVKNPAFVVIAAWLAREMWQSHTKSKNGQDEAIKENTKKMQELTISIIKLETKLEHIYESLSSIPKMKEDINALHGRYRSLQKE